jgi:hypothetical protein
VLLGFVGFATDVGVLLHERRILQSAADSAALAAATVLNNGGTTAAAQLAGQNDAALYGFSASQVTINNPVTDDSNPAFNDSNHVEAIVTESKPVIFMALLGGNAVSVSARAVASDTVKSQGCIYVPNNGGLASPAVDMGGNSLITAAGCGVLINGNLDMGGSASMNAGSVSVSGSIIGNDPSQPYAQGTQPISDPFPQLASMPAPSNFNLSNHTCSPPTGSTMSCVYDYEGGNISGALQSNTIYVFDETAGVTVNGGLTGSGVTIYLVGNIPFDYDSNGTVTLTPPPAPAPPAGSPAGTLSTCKGATNLLCGVLIDAPTDGKTSGTYTCSHGKGNNAGNNGELYFDFGSSSTTLTGIVYAPYAQIFTQDQGASTTIDTDLVVGNVCSQSSTLTVNGDSATTLITQAGLVE